MTIYFDYTAGRGKYDDYVEHEDTKESKEGGEQKKVIQEIKPILKANKEEKPQIKAAKYQVKTQIKEAKPQDSNPFYYSYENESNNKKEVYAYGGQQRKQEQKKTFKPAQNYNRKVYNAYKPKNGKSYRYIEFNIGSEYQRNDIQD